MTVIETQGSQKPFAAEGDTRPGAHPPRSFLNPLSLLAAVLGAVLVGLVGWLIVGVHIPTAGPAVVEKGLGVPSASWVLEAGGAVLWLGVFAAAVRSVVRQRTLAPWVLVFIGAQTMFWQEWYADWGAYLVYNPHFHLMPWHRTLFTSPNKPWTLVAVYGWYFTLGFPAILGVVGRICRVRPQWNRTATLAVVGAVMFYIENLLFEGFLATPLGWWSYVHHVGPAFHWAHATWPVFGPAVIFTVFGVVAVWTLDQRDKDGQLRLEVLSGAARVGAGWRREVARAATWVFTLNALYFLLLITPLVLIRVLFGSGSLFVP